MSQDMNSFIEVSTSIILTCNITLGKVVLTGRHRADDGISDPEALLEGPGGSFFLTFKSCLGNSLSLESGQQEPLSFTQFLPHLPKRPSSVPAMPLPGQVILPKGYFQTDC